MKTKVTREKINDTTYVSVIDQKAETKIEVEIGDSKQPDFKPQIKLKKWDNEVNLSIRYIGEKTADPETLVENNDIIEWQKGKAKSRFYNLSPSNDLPEGGYEFDLELLEKPKTNKFEFSLVDKGVRYYYQPPLTEIHEQKPGWIVTPTEVIDPEGTVVHKTSENAVGSYAVYMLENKKTYKGGKLYGTGKVGHIYRPKVWDANNDTVWGDLEIIESETGKKLIVTVSQDFLDNAVYPVVVDPTFGYTTAGSLSLTGNYIIGKWDTLSEEGDVSKITASVSEFSTGDSLQAGIYNAVETGAVLQGSTPTVSGSGSTGQKWVDLPFSTSVNLAAGNWFLPVWILNNQQRIHYDSAIGITIRSYYATTSNRFTWPTPQNLTGSPVFYSTYATYELPSAGTTVDDSRPFEIRGSAETNNSRPFEVRGSDTASNTRSLEIAGSATDDDSRPLEVRGSNTENDSRAIELRGSDTENNSRGFEMTGASAGLLQYGFRFRDDDGDETGATWLDSENVNVTRLKNVTTRLRITMDNNN